MPFCVTKPGIDTISRDEVGNHLKETVQAYEEREGGHRYRKLPGYLWSRKQLSIIGYMSAGTRLCIYELGIDYGRRRVK